MRPTIVSLLALLAAAYLAACGGSGSSGFDVSPLIEDEAIETALDAGECAQIRALQICPASDPTGQIPGNAPGPAPSGDRGAVFEVPPTDALDCIVEATSELCSFTLSFQTLGLPEDASFRTAVRALAPQAGGWVVGADSVAPGSSQQIALEIPAGATSVQVALLAFSGGGDTEPGPVQTLEDTGASYAVVTGPLGVFRLP